MSTLPLPVYLAITRASAVYDIVQILPFVTPWTFALLLAQLSRLNVWFGGAPLPPFAPLHLLLGTLLGTLVISWCAWRLLQPGLRLGRFDGAVRMVFALWIGWAMLVADLPMLWLYLGPELLWATLAWWPVQDRGSSTARAALTSAAPMRSRRGG